MCMEYFRWAKEVMMAPRKSTKKDLKYGDFTRRLAVLSLVSGVMSTIVTVAVFMTELSDGTDPVAWASAFMMVPVYLIGAVVSPFINGAINHFFGKFVFGFFKGPYKKTYNASAYSMVPRLLLAWIPVVGGIASGIWGLIVGVHAMMNQQKVSMGKALVVTFVPVVIAILVAVAIVFSGASLFDASSTMMPMMESV